MLVALICFFALVVAFSVNNWIAWICVIAGCILISLIPWEGYANSEETEVKLIRIKNGKYEEGYVRNVGRKAKYAYDNSKKYNFKGVAYEEKWIRGNIKIYESEECEEPILKIITKYPTRGFIAIALFATKTEYVFFVPMNSVNIFPKKKEDITILH